MHGDDAKLYGYMVCMHLFYQVDWELCCIAWKGNVFFSIVFHAMVKGIVCLMHTEKLSWFVTGDGGGGGRYIELSRKKVSITCGG